MKKIYLLIISAIISAGSFAQAVFITANPGTSQNVILGQGPYAVSESIYTNVEIGNNNYTTAGSAIQEVYYFQTLTGLSPNITNFRIYMKNVPAATTTFATGAYTTAGYTQVFNGTYDASAAGFNQIILTTPFQRVAGNNLSVLIENFSNNVNAGNEYECAIGNNFNATAASCRRVVSGTLPVSGTTSLAASMFRPLIVFNHTFPVDAIVNDIIFPSASCYNGPSTVLVEILNGGTTNIAAGAAATTLHVRGANTFTATHANTAVILPGESEFITFSGVSFVNPGDNFDTAYVTLAGDGTTYYDTLTAVNAAAGTISTFPISETVEEFYPIVPTSDLDVFRYADVILGDNLWRPEHGAYSNTFQTDPLTPLGAPTDSSYYIFDSFSDPNSEDFESRLYSECINLNTATAALLTFFMSHDNTPGLETLLDSMYVSVSTDKGITWNRINGYQRQDGSLTLPAYRMESINLAAYLGQTIQIGFEGVSKFGNAILLDNITISATLPVSVLNFNAQRNGKVNDLTWRTTQEINSSRFIIERSTDGGQTFTSIGQVTAAGNSSTERSYRFTDATPIKGYNYYRLRIVDLDGKFKVSDIRSVRNMGTADFSFAPNPVQQQMKIKLDADKADKGFVTVTDMSGKIVYSATINVVAGTNNLSIETGNFASGLYIINIQLSDDRIVKKFNKL